MTTKRKTSVTENVTVKNFTKEDCLEVIKIYRTKLNKQVSWYLLQTQIDPVGTMQRELNEVLTFYRARKLRSGNLTVQGQKKRQRRVRNTANKLFDLLAEATDSQFIADIVAAREGTSSYARQGAEAFRAVDGDLEALGYALNRFIDDLDLCLKIDSLVEFAKPKSRIQPETILIRKMSRVLTKYAEAGGYRRGAYRDKEPVEGWRIECLKYLLERVGISKTKSQILDSL